MTQPKIYTVNLFSSFSQSYLRTFTNVILHEEKKNDHTFQELLGIGSELTNFKRLKMALWSTIE